jgi:hypothetical protein
MKFRGILVCLLLTTFAGAQYQEEDQTRDHEYLDDRYQQRRAVEPPKDATLEDFLERAERLIRDRNYRSDGSDLYRVQSDDPRLDARSAVALLDDFRAFFDTFWEGRLELVDYDRRSRIFLFYSFHKFNEMLSANFRYNTIRPKGHYGSLFDVITMHTDSGCPEDLANSLVHEAAHQLVDQRLFGSDESRLEPWLSEGLASYFGFMFQDASGAFQPGKIGGKRADLLRDTRSRGCSDIKGALRSGKQVFKESGKAGEPVVEELLSAEASASFYGPGVRANYAVSWILVHFLLHGNDGAHREAFKGYLELAGRGEANGAQLPELLGMSLTELDAALAEHLKGMKVWKKRGPVLTHSVTVTRPDRED